MRKLAAHCTRRTLYQSFIILLFFAGFMAWNFRYELSFGNMDFYWEAVGHRMGFGRHSAARTRAIQAFTDVVADTNRSTSTFTNTGTSTFTICHHFPLTVRQHTSLLPCDFRSRPANTCDYRLRAKLVCSQSTAEIAYEWVKRDSPPAMYDYNDTCLARVVASKCHTDHAIPKLVHFVNFRRRELPFYSFVSIVSAFRVVQPCLILFHADYLPYGNHWELLVQMVPEVIHVLRKAPNSIFGRPVHVVEHQSDVARLEAMSKFGGIYSDFDYVLLNPLDDLLHHNVVMGMESGRFGNGFYMGQPGATFFKYWYDSYHTFNDGDWAGHSCAVPYEIFKKHPNLVHVVNTFHEPNWSIIHTDFYTKPFNWTKVYGIHLYSKLFSGILNRKLETLKSSVGEITRYTLFGNSQACLNKTH